MIYKADMRIDLVGSLVTNLRKPFIEASYAIVFRQTDHNSTRFVDERFTPFHVHTCNPFVEISYAMELCGNHNFAGAIHEPHLVAASDRIARLIWQLFLRRSYMQSNEKNSDKSQNDTFHRLLLLLGLRMQVP